MACEKPHHFHEWQTSGQLSIERCEHYCLFCSGAKAQKRWSSAWFLRRHVRETHAQQEFPDLVVTEGWQKRPSGNTRPCNKKQRAPGSNKKRAGTKKQRAALEAALADTWTYDEMSFADMHMTGAQSSSMVIAELESLDRVANPAESTLGHVDFGTDFSNEPSSDFDQETSSSYWASASTPELTIDTFSPGTSCDFDFTNSAIARLSDYVNGPRISDGCINPAQLSLPVLVPATPPPMLTVDAADIVGNAGLEGVGLDFVYSFHLDEALFGVEGTGDIDGTEWQLLH